MPPIEAAEKAVAEFLTGDAAARADKAKRVMAGLFAGTTFVCISPRVAQEIAGAGRETTVAAEPSEQAMFGVLRARARVKLPYWNIAQ